MKPEPFDPEEPEIVAFLAAYGMEDLDQQIMNWMGRQIGSESDGKLESVIQAFRHLKARGGIRENSDAGKSGGMNMGPKSGNGIRIGASSC